MQIQEKILVLGSLFHDVGKFQQRCENLRVKHPQLGANFANELKDSFTKILDNDSGNFNKFIQIIAEHHNPSASDLIKICRDADHLSASEREDAELNEKGHINWKYKFLASILGKINILDNTNNVKYYQQDLLTEKNYDKLIPTIDKDEDYTYSRGTFDKFKSDIKTVLSFYTQEDDFITLVNLILRVFEKYMWCVPDFTGSPETDISLFNHLKDTAGFSHALLKAKDENLKLIIGDIPGIQNYIFNLTEKKVPKILRGRSVFVQILSRVFASVMLKAFDLTDANLIMLAGGKFYIIAPDSVEFDNIYYKAMCQIDDILLKNFDFSLRFITGYAQFNYYDLRDKKITFGEIIEEASAALQEHKNITFNNYLFDDENFEENYVLDHEYVEAEDSNQAKCKMTGKPVNKQKEIRIDGDLTDTQTANEYTIGSEVVYNNLLVEFNDDFTKIVKKPKKLDQTTRYSSNHKILLNPELDDLLNIKDLQTNVFRDVLFVDVASYCSLEDENVMDFDEMSKKIIGAKYLTLIKGDIDNLGLIMAYGLAGDENNLTSVSRTTTLSNHLKYFFSTFLNGFLDKWEKGTDKKDHLVYTVFAGGDDLMLITTQSASLELVKEFNDYFNEFTCNNPEIHISYSLTNFHSKTPLRTVNELSEENQELCKNNLLKEIELDKTDSFFSKNNKACTRLFNTTIKNSKIDYILEKKSDFISLLEGNSKFSKGILRDLFELMEIKYSSYQEIKNSNLRWHPLLNYIVNRVLKDKNNQYSDNKSKEIFEMFLNMNRSNSTDFETIIYPLLCEVIYSIRN